MSKDATCAHGCRYLAGMEEDTRYSRWKRAFNALHIKRRPSNNLILSILDRRHSRLQMRMNWRNFERWVYLCLGFIIAHSSPTRRSPANVPGSDVREHTPLSHSMRCQCSTAYLGSWKGATLLFRNAIQDRGARAGMPQRYLTQRI